MRSICPCCKDDTPLSGLCSPCIRARCAPALGLHADADCQRIELDDIPVARQIEFIDKLLGDGRSFDIPDGGV